MDPPMLRQGKIVDCLADDMISPLLPQRILEQWDTYSMPVVLHQFSVPIDGYRFYGFLDFLPSLCRETRKNSCLSLATDALAKVYITNLSQVPLNRAEHALIYGRALKATNAALQDPLESVKDDTFIAVWILGIYEVKYNFT
jgi:hypothetical protein